MRTLSVTQLPAVIQMPSNSQETVIDTMQAELETIDEVYASSKRRFFRLVRLSLMTFVAAGLLAAAITASVIWTTTGMLTTPDSWLLMASIGSLIASLTGAVALIIGLVSLSVRLLMDFARTMVRELRLAVSRTATPLTLEVVPSYGVYDPRAPYGPSYEPPYGLPVYETPSYEVPAYRTRPYGIDGRGTYGGNYDGSRDPSWSGPRITPWSAPRANPWTNPGLERQSAYPFPPAVASRSNWSSAPMLSRSVAQTDSIQPERFFMTRMLPRQ